MFIVPYQYYRLNKTLFLFTLQVFICEISSMFLVSMYFFFNNVKIYE